MASTQDYATMVKDMMAKMPVDSGAMDAMFKSQSALAEKMSAVAIEAARKSTDLTARWAQDTLAKLSSMTQAKVEPADYAKSMTDFLSQSAQSASEHMSAFAEIAKKVQAETVELLMSGAKDMGTQMTDAGQHATNV